MATASVVKLDYGFQITGDSGATTISGADSQPLRVKMFAFTGTSCTITSESQGDYFAGDKSEVGSACTAFPMAAAGDVFFGERGIPFRNLTVTLSDVPDVLYVILADR